MVKSKKVKK